MKRKYLKKIALSSVVAFAIVMTFSFFTSNVFASGDNGSLTSTKQKLWYYALKDCIGNMDGWSQDYLCGVTCTNITSKKVRNGEWFRTDWTLDWSTNGGRRVWGGGAYVEEQVAGEYDDGKIICGENNNAIVSTGLAALQVSKLDVICDYRDNNFSSGVLYTDTSKMACEDKYNGDDHFSWNTNRSTYFETLIKDKTFNGSVPGGSLTSLTSLEEYYAKKISFEIACATGSPHFGQSMDYNVVLWNSSSNRFEQAGYSQKNNGTHKVYWWGGNQSTCQELADSLNVGSSVFNAYRDEKLQEAKEGCVSEYNAELDKIKSYRDQYYEIAKAGELFALNIKNLLYGLGKSSVPVYLYVDSGQLGDKLASPVTDAYSAYIDEQLPKVLAKINNGSVFQDNAFMQLAAAVKSVLSHSEISDNGIVSSTADDEDIEQANDWLEKVNDQVTVVRDNVTSLNNFISSHELSGSSNVPWEYEDNQQINITCPGKTKLSDEWSEFQEDLPGAPDIDGEFQQHEYIDPSDGIDSDAVEDPCYNAGIEGMSWILCPSLNNMVEATDGISGLLNDWLGIDSNLYNDSSNARTAWGYFRDMANVAVIIVLLVIIVSQVTGYGIDNYGIKKMLPRLLVMAVLINLSFIICQLAVDISNILGEGLNHMFQSIGLTISDKVGAEGFIAGLLDGIFAALGIVGAGAGAAITIISLTAGGGGGPMVVIFIVLMVLTALIAVLMFFLALGARFIIILVFTAISPLAFACYILPNTQSLFKKWWNVYRMALVVYPICGALYGVSFIIRAIVLQDGNGVHLWQAMIAIAAPFLPFLVLPSLTKGAIAGLGVIGGTLSGLGSGLRRGLSSGQTALQNTAAFKSAQEESNRNLNYKMAGFKRNKNGGWEENKNMTKFGRFLRGGDRGIVAAKRRVLADERARNDEKLIESGGFEAGMTAQRKAAEAEEIGNWETLVKDRTNDGANEDALFEQYREYVSSGNKYGARAVARIAGRRKDTAARFLDEFKKTDFSSKGGRDAAASVAKEIAEGANSRNYLSAAPLAFDFASQINKMGVGTQAADGSWAGGANFKYSGEGGWLNPGTIDQAMDNYVTDSSELVGVKGSSLKEILGQMDRENGGQMSDATITRLRNLATETIANRDKGPWDSTKAEQLCAMTGGAFKFENGQIIDMRGNTNSSTPSRVENELKIEHPKLTEEPKSPIITGASEEEFKKAKLEFDQQNQGNRKYPGNEFILPK